MQSASIETLMNRHGISMQLSKLQSSGCLGASTEEAVDRYMCRMRRSGEKMDLYVAVPCEDGNVSASDVLFLFVLDASGCEMFKDYHGRREELKEMLSGLGQVHDAFEEFWLEYESRHRTSMRLRTFLGVSLYEMLLERFGFDN